MGRHLKYDDILDMITYEMIIKTLFNIITF